MKKRLIFGLCVLGLLSSCQQKADVPTPKRIIARSQMQNIMYDIMLLDAIKAQSLPNNPYVKVTSARFIQKKYGIDSLTYAQNVMYYAADVESYKALCQEVKTRLEEQSRKP